MTSDACDLASGKEGWEKFELHSQDSPQRPLTLYLNGNLTEATFYPVSQRQAQPCERFPGHHPALGVRLEAPE